MRILPLVALAAIFFAGCDQGNPTSVKPVPPVGVDKAPPANVEIGGPQGGVHVDDPAGGTRVDVDATGVHVKTPDSKVEVP